uniref:DNA-binding protein inhibitor ID-2 n=1 Tax=Geotrypetes seraphini TaxID=260995 RepID=A0A6P8PTM3_GEOSA|nr:DNA-binding protein inhibitor ID-2 [Geotrypetes seraphini]
MKAFSPVRSVRKSSLSEHSLSIGRTKSLTEEPLSLLYNMNDCYSKLRELVPSIPQHRKVSKMEILQHVIDYILDLQIALDSHPSIVSLHHPRPQQQQQQPSSRTPLTAINTDISVLSLQASDFPSELMMTDSKMLCP